MNKLSIPRQLLLFVVICVGILLISSIVGGVEQFENLKTSTALTKTSLGQLSNANKLLDSISDSERLIQGLLRESDTDVIEKSVGDLENKQKTAVDLINSAGSKVAAIKAKHMALTEAQKKVLDLFLTGKGALAYDQFNGPCSVQFNATTDQIRSYVTNIQNETDSALVAFRKKNISAMCVQAILLMLLLAALSFLGWRIKTFITRSLVQLCDQLSSSSLELDEETKKISEASRLVAEGATSQAASLEETSATMEEMTSMTQRNAESAGNAKVMTQEGCSTAQKATADISSMTEALRTIAHSSEHLRAAMDKIESSSRAITQILKTIDEIAFQTNILSLNAAVEAARAGESGAGFAVVADEVRALAKRSADAARETAAMIKESVDSSQQGKNVAEQVASELEGVNKISVQVNSGLQSIAEQVQRVDQAIAEIAGASKEQSQGIGQVNSALGQMDKVTQSNAAGAEESAAATHGLKEQVIQVRSAVDQLHQLVNGQHACRDVKLPLAPVNGAVTSRPGSGEEKRKISGRSRSAGSANASVR